jgi:hypothetical protein
MKYFLLAVASFFMVSQLDGASPFRTAVEKDATVFFNDNGDTLDRDSRSTLTLVGEMWRVRKTFDLTALPAGTIENSNSAAIRLHMQVLDQSSHVYKRPANGVTEEFKLIFNGKHVMQLKLSDSRISSRRKWVEIPFPKEYLTGKTFTVEIEKIKSEHNDDFLYLSFDPTAGAGATDFSVTGGKTWHKSSRHFSKTPGELFCRLVLSSDAPEIALDFTRGLPAGVRLHGGAAIKDKALFFDGSTGAAELLNTAALSPDHQGFTMSAVVKLSVEADSEVHRVFLQVFLVELRPLSIAD